LTPLSAAPSSSITAEDLAERLRESKSWEEIEAVATANEQHKRAAWRLLSPEEQNQVLVLKLQAKQEENQSKICVS
jgi:Xaa-Pro aminopeptidase